MSIIPAFRRLRREDGKFDPAWATWGDPAPNHAPRNKECSWSIEVIFCSRCASIHMVILELSVDDYLCLQALLSLVGLKIKSPDDFTFQL
jgi:hypothetical protein